MCSSMARAAGWRVIIPRVRPEIAAIAAAVLVIVALVYWFSEGGSGRRHADLGGVWTAAWTAESETELENEEEIPWVYLETVCQRSRMGRNSGTDMLFWKWSNKENQKRQAGLIIRPGQDAIFLYNGKVEGIFRDEGSYDIESDIIPFLSTLKGFKFGFNSGLRAEVLFINTKEVLGEMGEPKARF